MLRRRLIALEHPTPDIDINDPKVFASTVVWLEDRKLRQYKIEDREPLRKVNDLNQWEIAYGNYKRDIDMPKFEKRFEEMTWLTSLAIRYEYTDQIDVFKNISSEDVSEQKNEIKNSNNPFDKLDFNDGDFINGCRTIAEVLNIPYHPDHLLQLEAAAILIKERVGKSSKNNELAKGKTFPFEKGNDVVAKDSNLDLPVRIMRLIEIHKLRDLQTKINETIVAIQELTANPKTDSKLGKVGVI